MRRKDRHRKIGVTKKGDFNFRIHHGDWLLDDEVTFTLPAKHIEKDLLNKITLAFFIAGWVAGKTECDVIAKAILGMTKAQNSALGGLCPKEKQDGKT